MVWFTQFFGPLQGYQPTLPASPRRTLRVPAQPRTLALASDLRSSRAVHFFDHRRLLAADDPSASPYAINALLPMSVSAYHPDGAGDVPHDLLPERRGRVECVHTLRGAMPRRFLQHRQGEGAQGGLYHGAPHAWPPWALSSPSPCAGHQWRL